MANTITAGNGTNNGLAVTSDGSGALNILTGSGAGTAAISIDSSQNVTAAANLSVTGNATITGTLSATNGITGSLKSATAQASTSGTSIDFTSIPSGVKRITVMFNGVSTNSTSFVQVQLGTSGGIQTTSYLSQVSWTGASTGTGGPVTSGFVLDAGTPTAASLRYGAIVFNLLDSSTGLWVGNSVIGHNISGTCYAFMCGGSKTLSGTLDRVRITTVNGTDTFDAGTINIIYE